MNSQLVSQMVMLVFGFFLTTVLGGFLGFFFQNRSWRHQHQTQLFDSARETARDVYEAISILMDKRLYRMRLLYWYLQDNKPGDDEFENYLVEYRKVLYQWNDNLVRNLAFVQAYFGDEARKILEGTIYEDFVRIGSRIEKQINIWKIEGNIDESLNIGLELDKLGSKIYRLNFLMLRLIQQGKVGFDHLENVS